MIKKVVLWSNGMVMVFDEAGEQMSEYQGPFRTKRKQILEDAPEGTEFNIGTWQEGTVPMHRQQFASEGWDDNDV